MADIRIVHCETSIMYPASGILNLKKHHDHQISGIR